MNRLAFTWVALLCLLSTASANSAQKNDRHVFSEKSAPKSDANEKEHSLVITEKTEIKLDGRACAYADVPSDAVVILLEVAADQQTIRKIHFRSKK